MDLRRRVRADEGSRSRGPVSGLPLAAAAGPAAGAAPADVSAPSIDPRPRQRAEAVSALERDLASDRLWATVTAIGDDVEIRSGQCTDDGVSARVDAAKARLGELGFRAVRCLDRGGAPMWSQALP
jgi:hypothetical protein